MLAVSNMTWGRPEGKVETPFLAKSLCGPPYSTKEREREIHGQIESMHTHHEKWCSKEGRRKRQNGFYSPLFSLSLLLFSSFLFRWLILSLPATEAPPTKGKGLCFQRAEEKNTKSALPKNWWSAWWRVGLANSDLDDQYQRLSSSDRKAGK